MDPICIDIEFGDLVHETCAGVEVVVSAILLEGCCYAFLFIGGWKFIMSRVKNRNGRVNVK